MLLKVASSGVHNMRIGLLLPNYITTIHVLRPSVFGSLDLGHAPQKPTTGCFSKR